MILNDYLHSDFAWEYLHTKIKTCSHDDLMYANQY